jgi:hypothetical protein
MSGSVRVKCRRPDAGWWQLRDNPRVDSSDYSRLDVGFDSRRRV